MHHTVHGGHGSLITYIDLRERIAKYREPVRSAEVFKDKIVINADDEICEAGRDGEIGAKRPKSTEEVRQRM